MSPTRRRSWSSRALHRALVGLGAVALASSLEAQKRPEAPRSPTPQDTARIELFEPTPLPDIPAEMLASMERWTALAMAAQMRLLTKPETMAEMARFTKGYFDALLREGFTREEAIRIVSGQRIPMPFQR